MVLTPKGEKDLKNGRTREETETDSIFGKGG